MNLSRLAKKRKEPKRKVQVPPAKKDKLSPKNAGQVGSTHEERLLYFLTSDIGLLKVKGHQSGPCFEQTYSERFPRLAKSTTVRLPQKYKTKYWKQPPSPPPPFPLVQSP